MKIWCRMITNVICFSITLLFVLCLEGTAQENRLHPGQYITEGGWGNLSIKPGKGETLIFILKTVGGNAHTCDLQGQILGGRATLKTFEKGNPCVVIFSASGENVNITSNGDECSFFCGARASFEGLYLKPCQGCSAVDVQKIRGEFKRLYNRKAFDKARMKLEPVLRNCKKTLNWLEEGWIRNDLAVTQYKLHDLDGCRKTLRPLAADAAMTEQQLKEQYPPTDADNYMPIVEATRTNLKLCNTGTKGPP
jgi:hypothetical protein